jgi:hypothetical protein
MEELSKSARVTIFEIMTLMFIYLKLTNQIDWNWVQVLSPILFIIGLALTILVVKKVQELRK